MSIRPIAKVKMHKGTPTLFINDAPYPAYAYFFPLPVKEYIEDFAKVGVHLYTWGWSDIIEHSMDMGWIGSEKYDYSRLDKEVEMILGADSQAYLIPRVAVSAPLWWLKEHPDEMIVFHDGTRQHTSMASRVWLEEASKALINFIKHIRNMPYSDHIIGYQLTGGVNEWFYVSHEERRFPDFSKASLYAFRNWLREKYNDNVSALRKAWKMPKADFENVTIPDKAERLKTDLNLLRDPLISRYVSDYYEFFSDINANALIYFCKVGKKTTENENIFGAFYGYIINEYSCPYPQHFGHQALRKVLESPYIDFLCAPYQYYNRGPGGTDASQSVVETVKLHGKLWFTECDHPTFMYKRGYRVSETPLLKKTSDVIINLKERMEGGIIPTLEETLGIMKRDFSHRLIRRIGMWWMDLIPEQGWYHHPEIMKYVAKMKKIMEKSLYLDRSYKGEIAIIVDEETPYYVKPGNELFYPLVFLQDRCGLSRIGTPYDIYLHNDLSNPFMPDYKLYIFLNTLYLTKEERRAIKDKVQRNGSTVMWLYAPGFISEGGLSIEGVRDLVGMKISYRESKYNLSSGNGGPIQLYLTDFNHPITKGISSSTFFGTNSDIGPIFYCVDPTARTLGRLLPAPQGVLCQPGFTIKEFNDWTSIFIGAPNIPANILRNIAYYAGCHIYCDDDDIVYASKYFLAIHTNSGGYKKIQLPRKSDVYDAFSEELVAKNVKEFTDQLQQYDTKLYFLGDISKIADKKSIIHKK